jgi:hypothetical protein
VPSLQKVGPKGERLGRCRPMLNGAHGISGTPDGDILLAEGNPSRITRLRLQPASLEGANAAKSLLTPIFFANVG